MNLMIKKISLLGLSAAVLVSSVLSVEAMPIASAPVVKSDVEQVQYWRDGPPPRWERDRYYRDRYYRPRHRSHNDAWVPLAAFAAGALIGGAVASQPRYEQPRYAPAPRRYVAPAGAVNPRHYEYCASRYRSYDSYSNTFQPYEGPRQPCYSPYY